MAEYIDAEAVKRVIRDLSLHGTVTATPQQLEAAIDDIPAADVEPVRHGRWDKPLDRRMKSRLRCSECKGLTYASWDYCPHCGAKMDGEA